ncbi:hypothetical protein J4526_09110 [Desulfurococcaceae archaeon MEX13E-LK6-19]|nr:hypothetical protein J4526_09110 [Desulfurococcaceae archaeon MEX13E-LK6-19]
MHKLIILLILTILLASMTITTNIIITKGLRINLYATRTIDGDPSDWVGIPPSTDNNYTYSNGEWIWRDAVNDVQDVPNVDITGADITEIRVTSNSTHLFLLIKFSNLTSLGQSGEPGIFITIDIDHTTGSGNNDFAYASETYVASSGDANWERQIVICLSVSTVADGVLIHGDGVTVSNGGSPLDILDTQYNDVSSVNSVFAASSVYNTVEAAIAWSDLGIDPSVYFANGNYLRIEVITTGMDSNGLVIEYLGPTGSDPTVSDAVDAMSLLTTPQEVSDNNVDYYADILFTNDPTPAPENGVLIALVFIITIIIVIIKLLYKT